MMETRNRLEIRYETSLDECQDVETVYTDRSPQGVGATAGTHVVAIGGGAIRTNGEIPVGSESAGAPDGQASAILQSRSARISAACSSGSTPSYTCWIRPAGSITYVFRKTPSKVLPNMFFSP